MTQENGFNEKVVNEIIDRFEEKLGRGLQVCELGSCQYATLQYSAEFVLELLDAIGEEKTEELLGITYSKKVTDLEKLERKLTQFCDETDWLDPDSEDDISFKELIEKEYPDYKDDYMDRRISLQAYLEITRNQAWDLWSAMPSIFSHLEIRNKVPVPTYGPIFNMMAQEENFELGLDMAYLIYHFRSVGVKLEDFAGYDT